MLLCVILVWPTKFENSLSFMQNMFAVWEFKDNWLKTLFLRIWVQYKCFWKAFHLIPMHFIHKILCFEEFLHKIALFFLKIGFSRISIEPVSRSIEIAIKILVWLYVFRSVLDCYWINQMYFQSIKNRIESFLKPLFLTCSSLFKPFSKHFLSLFDRSKGQSARFLLFSSKFLQGFLSSKAGKTFIPLLFHLFSCFMHFRENVEPKGNWDFWWFNLFLSQLINGFLLWDVIKLFLVN